MSLINNDYTECNLSFYPNTTFFMFWSQIVSVIFQKAVAGVTIDPSAETDFVRAINTVLCILQ